jgi:hypothetical protein
MTCKKLLTGATLLWILAAGPVWAQSEDDQEASGKGAKERLRQAAQLMDVAKSVGPWDRQYQIMDEATENVFSQQGWNSEPDHFARNVMREVGRVPPWEPQKRQEVFLNQLQGRYGLTHDQLRQFDKDFQREGMTLAVKHFKDVFPIVLEAAKTRAADEPFTPDQVQRWTTKLRPLLDEGAETIERVTGKLMRTMTPDQRRVIETDLKAFRRRHNDVKQMAERWASGKWTPADWGLQNDPVHAGEMFNAAASAAERDALVEQVLIAKRPDEERIARSEDEWERYVKWFCNTYQCDDRQRSTAAGILAGSRKEAIAYRAAKRDVITQFEGAIRQTDDGQRRKSLGGELDRVLQPISDTFERMKRRLYEEVLTTAQRIKFTPPQAAKAPTKPEGE